MVTTEVEEFVYCLALTIFQFINYFIVMLQEIARVLTIAIHNKVF